MSEIKIKKPHLLHRRFQLPSNCTVKSFVMREIDGEDERQAGKLVSALGSTNDDGTVLMEEQIRIAIVGVNDEAVDYPYAGIKQWSTKTRRLLLEAYLVLNGVEDDELAVFRGAATDLGATQSEAVEMSESELLEAKQQG